MGDQPRERWSDERLDDFVKRYDRDQQRAREDHQQIKTSVDTLAENMRDGFDKIEEERVANKAALRAQTTQILVALIAAAATIAAALLASGSL